MKKHAQPLSPFFPSESLHEHKPQTLYHIPEYWLCFTEYKLCIKILLLLFQPHWQGHSLPPTTNMLPLSESPILELTEQMESI